MMVAMVMTPCPCFGYVFNPSTPSCSAEAFIVLICMLLSQAVNALMLSFINTTFSSDDAIDLL